MLFPRSGDLVVDGGGAAAGVLLGDGFGVGGELPRGLGGVSVGRGGGRRRRRGLVVGSKVVEDEVVGVHGRRRWGDMERVFGALYIPHLLSDSDTVSNSDISVINRTLNFVTYL